MHSTAVPSAVPAAAAALGPVITSCSCPPLPPPLLPITYFIILLRYADDELLPSFLRNFHIFYIEALFSSHFPRSSHLFFPLANCPLIIIHCHSKVTIIISSSSSSLIPASLPVNSIVLNHSKSRLNPILSFSQVSINAYSGRSDQLDPFCCCF